MSEAPVSEDDAPDDHDRNVAGDVDHDHGLSGVGTDVAVDRPDQRQAVVDMRRRRQRRRLGSHEWGELAYRVYTTSLAAIVAVVFASGLIGDDPLTADARRTFLDRAPAWFGLGAAVVLLIGIRSGSRGGPLALERQDVNHLLLGPVDRGFLLRRPAVGILSYALLGGAVLAGLGAGLFDQRLGGSALPWFACGALFGVALAGLAVGAGFLTASRLTSKWVPLAIGWLLVAWALADATGYAPTAPTTWLGTVVVWPLEFDPLGLVPVVASILLPVVGLLTIGGLSIEAATRRTALVGQLRFAVTQQDLRTVVLLRRQLASERPRTRPWFPATPRFVARRFPVFARDMRSVARWPIVRVARVVVMGAAIGLTARATWAGTTPLVLVLGALSYVAALDAIEPLAQDVDHPGLLGSVPQVEGVVMVKHLAEPVIVMIGVGVVALATAYGVDPDPQVLGVGLPLLIPAALAGVCGAAITVVSEATLETSQEAVMPPEVAGPRLLFRTVWPPAVAVIGMLPLLAARAAATSSGGDPTRAVTATAVPVVLLCMIVVGWVRFRADLHDAMATAAGGGR
ncbi:hypothetical protein [Dermatobacter hominis]|uniref:hypothetical protein n=1 Tax=Dermatobacter hominis TaxID=2884263 RepID=UPI001D0FF0AF|nr:hypothetical protein [Dermatobacter hominis]UDY36540.1 hypothetical protein LH044_03145 [Dermatobacter hominis]